MKGGHFAAATAAAAGGGAVDRTLPSVLHTRYRIGVANNIRVNVSVVGVSVSRVWAYVQVHVH